MMVAAAPVPDTVPPVTGSQLAREAMEYASVLLARAHLVGTFSCRGKVSMKALEVLMQSPEHEAWADMAASASTHPDESDLEDARAFAQFIRTYITRNRRWNSPKYLIGESYGTTRAAGLSGYLTDRDCPINGVMLLSAVIDSNAGAGIQRHSRQ